MQRGDVLKISIQFQLGGRTITTPAKVVRKEKGKGGNPSRVLVELSDFILFFWLEDSKKRGKIVWQDEDGAPGFGLGSWDFAKQLDAVSAVA